jgi:hypothetical protein
VTELDLSNLVRFRDEALRRGVPADEVERWMSTARPCITLGGKGDGPVAGQWGGNPMLPLDAPAHEYPLLAAVDFALLPPGATDLPLPADGTLLWFVDGDGVSGGWEESFAVVYVPAGTPVAERVRPSTDDGDAPVYERQDLHVRRDLSLPNRGRPTEEFPHAEPLGAVWWDKSTDMPGEGPVTVGGHPWQWNFDPLEVVEDDPDRDWLVLLEVAGDERELDLGLFHLLIRRPDLAERRFDRCQLSWDMVG